MFSHQEFKIYSKIRLDSVHHFIRTTQKKKFKLRNPQEIQFLNFNQKNKLKFSKSEDWKSVM